MDPLNLKPEIVIVMLIHEGYVDLITNGQITGSSETQRGTPTDHWKQCL